MKKILILAANPRGDLKLDREVRDLEGVINTSPNSDQLQVVNAPAVRVGDLQELFFRHRPQIVHFCGHGGGDEGLVFESDVAREHQVRTEALAETFRLVVAHVGCVECMLLNACYSEKQAEAIVQHIDYVVGMNQTIQDKAAIAFSKGFYRALGYSLSIEQAYEFGKNAIQLEVSGSSVVRSTVTETERKANVPGIVARVELSEHLKPVLKIRPGVSVRPKSPDPVVSPERRAEILVEIDRSLAAGSEAAEADAAQRYRQKVREFLADRKLSPLERMRLEQMRKDLGLSEPEAAGIVAEEEAPILKAQGDYEALLLGLIEAGHYPLDGETEAELRSHGQDLGLTPEEEAQISGPILAAAEVDYRERLERLERQQQQAEVEARRREELKREQYQREFERALEAGYPLDELVREGVKRLQDSLGLSDGVVAEIEQPLVAPKQAEYQRQQEEQRQRGELERQRMLAEQRQREEQESQQALERQRELERQQQAAAVAQERKNRASIQFQRFEFDVITVDIKGREIDRSRQSSELFIEDLGNGVCLEMVSIPKGDFLMESPDGQGANDESPQHRVTLNAFSLGKYAITQAQWRVIAALPREERELNPDPSRFKGDNYPVETVSWDDAREFCARLSHLTSRSYRLPSEAEWEYACRAGTATDFHFGPALTPKLAQCKVNLGMARVTLLSGQTASVGSYLPNALGLYDMHGNVWEWCEDEWHDSYEGAPMDGSSWGGKNESERSLRLLRGGSWLNDPRYCCSANRNWVLRDSAGGSIGFRVACCSPPRT